MRLRLFVLAALLFLTLPFGKVAQAVPPSFGVAAHSDVNIEWWYVNAHVTTEKGRHLALIGSFFQFGAGLSSSGLGPPFPAHYLIYAVTDLDKKTQRSYSLADRTMQLYSAQLAAIQAASHPRDTAAQHMAALLARNELPPPHQIMSGGVATVTNAPFRLDYGYGQNTLTSLNAGNTSFLLHLGGKSRNPTEQDEIRLTLTEQKPPMAVGGTGETGLKSPTDMYYFSLTRCAVGGTIDTGTGPEKITGGLGWFDHQWGNSWVASNDGWDWWGVQMDDGTDILFFRQRDLKTGRIFFPLATFMDKDGHQSVTKNIVFTPDKSAFWKSTKSGVTYPLGWTVSFPEKSLQLHITAKVQNQEMPILGPGAGIWEGVCDVTAFWPPPRTGSASRYTFMDTSGIAYMELVGYSSPAVRGQVSHTNHAVNGTAIRRGRRKSHASRG